ncbi:MAG: undecaprenyl-phosphate glucose phosphotransferase [Candidatus Dadabacteria bacterium]|nr:MAG: undecaprenyl-phosphate glucose phosphotransferase [Candidatus Dadabacteria bacterium]
MLKQKRQLFEFMFMASDLLVVTVAWFLAYWFRFLSGVVPIDKGVPPFSHYLSMVLFIWLIWAFVFRRMGLYRPMRGVRRVREIWMLVNANVLALLLFISVTYLFREKSIPYSRLVFVYFGLLATAFTVIQRSFLRFVLRELRRKGYNLRYLLIVGAGKVAADIATRVRLHRELGIQLLGCLSRTGKEKKGPRGIPVIGSYDDLPEILDKMDIDQVVVALPLEDNNRLPDIMSMIGDSLVDVRIVPDIYQFVTLGGHIEEFEGLPVIAVRSSPLEGPGLIIKRICDLVLASVLLVLLSPLMVIIAVLVKLTSRGPVFYRQERVSYDGSRFNIYKFRTMYVDAEKSGPGWTRANDSRVTPFGRFLRHYNLDELPQLYNVLRGDMSIVGPRPERPVFIQDFRKKIPRYMLRHKVPAGMTGWAQVNGWRGDTSIDKRIEYDLYYIENWSLLLDFKILCLTLLKGFRDRNAY